MSTQIAFAVPEATRLRAILTTVMTNGTIQTEDRMTMCHPLRFPSTRSVWHSLCAQVPSGAGGVRSLTAAREVVCIRSEENKFRLFSADTDRPLKATQRAGVSGQELGANFGHSFEFVTEPADKSDALGFPLVGVSEWLVHSSAEPLLVPGVQRLA